MKRFENEWTQTHDAMVSNIEQKEKLIARLIQNNIDLKRGIADLIAVYRDHPNFLEDAIEELQDVSDKC